MLVIYCAVWNFSVDLYRNVLQRIAYLAVRVQTGGIDGAESECTYMYTTGESSLVEVSSSGTDVRSRSPPNAKPGQRLGCQPVHVHVHVSVSHHALRVWTLWRRRPLSISDASVAFVSLTHLAFCFSEYDGPRFRRLCNRPEAQSFLFSRLSIESLSNKKSYRRCIAV